MSDLSKVLGQDDIINAILNIFNSNSNEAAVVFLQGDSGTGKTYITERIRKAWKDEDQNRESLFLEGDIMQAERPLYPFNIGLIKQVAIFEKRKNVRKGASEMLKGIPFAGDFASFLLEKITDSKKDSKQTKLSFLKKEEFELLLAFNSFYKNSTLFIIADNLHWWDEASVSFLNALLSKDTCDAFPFLKFAKILGIITTDQTCLASDEINELKLKSSHSIFQTSKISKEKFKSVLDHFDIKSLGKQNEELLFDISGGHLEVVKTLFQDTPLQEIAYLNESLSIRASKNDISFLEKIFSLRLQRLGADAQQIIGLLEYASVIGLNFNFEEILCLTKENEESLLQIITKAKEAHLIDVDQQKNSFSHEIIREFFWCRIQSKKSEYFKKFASCLSQLRPGEYFQRGNVLMEAGLIKESLLAYLLGYFKNLHDGIPVSALIKTRIEEFCKLYNWEEYFVLMTEAHKNFTASNYKHSRYLVSQIEDIYPDVLLAEKYHLLSLCLSKTMDRNDLLESKNCLLSWDLIKTKESELWIRIMLTLISRYAHLGEYHEASAVERKIMMFLSERISFDPIANYGLNVLRRKASILHIGEIACKRTALSLSYFGETTSWFTARFPVQYFMALANHSGNLIVAGDFESAYNYAQQAILFKETFPEVTFPRIEIPVNNFVLAGFLSEKLTSNQGLAIYEALFSTLENTKQRILLQNNYFVFKALNNNLSESLTLCEEINNHLETTTRNDSYYKYFVGINRAVIQFLAGQKLAALKIMDELKLFIPQIPDKHYLQRRHELIQIQFNTVDIMNPYEWNESLLDKFPQEIGPSWRFFGKGFLLSDMQFWSDS